MQAEEQMKEQCALQIVTRLIEGGYAAMYAGGFVRDMVLGRPDRGDIDIATNATPPTIARLFPHTVAVGEQFGVMIVVCKGIPFEVATFRSDIGIGDGRHPHDVVFTDARTDAQRRDFTINGMFYDPIADTVIDYVGGRDDLREGVVRAIGDPDLRFREDYLRMMRAIRFASGLGFRIDQATWSALKKHASKITDVSQERIFAELDRMLRQSNPEQALDLLRDSGLLESVLPEVAGLAGVAQPPAFHPEGDVFTHTMRTLSMLPPKPSQVLAWAALLHDVGKPATMTVSDRIRFNNHDHVGAEMARAVLRRLRAPVWLIDAVWSVVDTHMKFINVTGMRMATLKRFLSRETILDDLELHRADCLASHGDLTNYDFVQHKLSTLARETIKPPPLLRGRDLIELGYKPGPQFGVILNEIYDLQLDEKVNTREEAVEIARTRMGTPTEGNAGTR